MIGTRIEAGVTSEEIIAFWDVLPTIAELLKLPVPQGKDGISFLASVKGLHREDHEFLYWDYGHVRNRFKQAVRWQDWKDIKNGAEAEMELYNLAQDPGESASAPENLHGVGFSGHFSGDSLRGD